MQNFALEYMLVSKNAKICVTLNENFKICVSLNAKPQRKSVEYKLRWVPNANFLRWPGHVHFILFVLISFVLASQREPYF